MEIMVKYIENISDQDIASLNIPTGIPLVYEFDNKLRVKKKYYLANAKDLKTAIQQTATQGKKK